MNTRTGGQRTTVPVGPFRVVDGSPNQVIQEVVAAAGRQHTAYALHVGGLNHLGRRQFVEAMNAASTVYADGVSVTGLARLAGARSIQRAATTDLGWALLHELARRLGRPPRVVIIGGPPGLAERAGEALEVDAPVAVVQTMHGFRESYEQDLMEARRAQPDVVIVGMGMPLEAEWVDRHLSQLPNCLILTCGGWLGFIAGDEVRAPAIFQTLGLEWAFRLIQDPGRLWRRYFKGVWTILRILPQQFKARSGLSI